MTGVSTLGQSLNRIKLFTDQQTLLDSLTTQLASGKKTQKFSGLGSDILTVQRARADVKTVDTYLTNIKNADRRLELMSNSIKEFKKQAQALADFLVQFTQSGSHQKGDIVYYDDPLTTENENVPVGYTSADPDIDFQNIVNFSNTVSGMFQDLLNEKDGSRYLFAGAETLTQPVAKNGALDTAIGTLINNWKAGTITTDDLIADLQDRTTSGGNNDAITDTIVGYSSALSGGTAKNVLVRVDERTELNITALANEGAFRDVLVAVAYLKNESLPPIGDEVDPDTLAVLTEGAPGADLNESKENFFAVFQAVTQSVVNAIDELDQISFRLENVRARIAEIKTSHTSEKNLLINTVSNIEDVDLNEVALSINTLAIQLEASYRVTADVQMLSLVNFLR